MFNVCYIKRNFRKLFNVSLTFQKIYDILQSQKEKKGKVKMNRLIFDMDGTIAALYNVKNWLPKLRAEDTSPYAEAAPMWDMEMLSTILKNLSGWEVVIVSWGSKNATPHFDEEVKKAKIDWLNQYNFPVLKRNIHVVPYGTPKQRYKAKKNYQSILIDDNEEIREKFRSYKNCSAVDPANTDIIQFVASLV